MLRHIVLFSCFATLMAACLLFSATPARALEIDNIRIGLHSDKTRLVIDMDNAATYSVRMAANPYQIIIDLPQFSWAAGQITKPSGTVIGDIKKGTIQPGVSRIIVELTKPAVVKSVFPLPAKGGDSDRLVIDFVPSSMADFVKNMDKRFGKLSYSPATTAASTPSYSAPRSKTYANRSDVLIPGKSPVEQAQHPVFSAGGIVVPQIKPETTARQYRPVERPVVVIDPGHGGVDPGSIGTNGLFEKNVTLAIAKDLKKQIESTGRYKVYMTRTTDDYLRLYKRVDFARKHKADLFVSIHADSIQKADVHGSSIYTLSDKASDEQTERLAQQENRADMIAGVDLSHEDHDIANILVDLTMRDTMNQSRFLANTIIGKMSGNGIAVLKPSHRYAGFAVLKAPDVPSVLIEVGFMSNRTEAGKLAESGYRTKVAASILRGIDAYFDQLNVAYK